MNEWWGYIHTNKSIQVKRYFSKLDTDEANESPFVSKVYGPFKAKDRADAIEIIRKKYIKTKQVIVMRKDLNMRKGKMMNLKES